MKTFVTCLTFVWATAAMASPPIPFVPPIPKQESPERQRLLEREREQARQDYLHAQESLKHPAPPDSLTGQVGLANSMRCQEFANELMRLGVMHSLHDHCWPDAAHCDDRHLKMLLDRLAASVSERQFEIRAEDYLRAHASHYVLYGIRSYAEYFAAGPPVFVPGTVLGENNRDTNQRLFCTRDRKIAGVLPSTLFSPQQLVPGRYVGNRDELATYVSDIRSQIRVLHLALINRGQIKDAPPSVK